MSLLALPQSSYTEQGTISLLGTAILSQHTEPVSLLDTALLSTISLLDTALLSQHTEPFFHPVQLYAVSTQNQFFIQYSSTQHTEPISHLVQLYSVSTQNQFLFQLHSHPALYSSAHRTSFSSSYTPICTHNFSSSYTSTCTQKLPAAFISAH